MSETSIGLSDRGTGRDLYEILTTNKKVIFFESALSIFLIWFLLGQLFGVVDTISSPSLVAQELYTIIVSGEFLVHLIPTSIRVLYAFVLTLVVGTALGLLMGVSDFWETALKDYVIVGLAVPSLFAVVFSAMWFGYTDITPMVAGAAISFPYLTQSLYQGVNDVDSDLLRMSKSFDVSRSRIIRRLVVRSVLPEWVGGVRYSLSLTWKIVVLAELFMAERGLGFMIQWELERLSMAGIITWTILFVFVILVIEYGIIQQFEKRAFSWREDTSGTFT
jgi:ABC-type nitrate/sulfonate/bicarbonate transport system permease component